MDITKKINESRLLRACLACSGLLAGTSAPALEFNVAQIDGNNGFTALGHTAFDFLGNTVSSAGDLNGDGYDDFFLGAYGASVSNKGQVYVLFGRDVSGSGPFLPTINLASLADPDGFVLNGVAANERAGTALASIGDVNADGIDDVIIGASASNESTGNFASGAAYVVFGRDTTQMGVSFPNPFELSSLKTGGGADGFAMYGANGSDNAGISVAGGFDLNGDGIADLAVGADGPDVNDGESGEVYVVFGRDTGSVGNFPQTRSLPDLASGDGSDGFVIRGPSENARTGTSLAFVGDVNDDGFDDLIIGATYLGDAASPGQAYVIFGRNTSMSGTFPAVFELSTLAGGGGAVGFVLNGIGTDDSLGYAVGAAGDVNNDGIDDIIVGDPQADDNGDNAGQAYLVFGRNSAFPGQFELSTLATGGGTDGFVLNGIDFSARPTGAGFQVGSAGDFNGDGVGDVFVSDEWASAPSIFYSGEVYVVYGQDTGVVGNFDQVIELGDLAPDAGTLGLVIHGQDGQDKIGAAALAGDIDDDGRADLVIGASEADPNGGNSGEVYVLFSPGRINTPPEVTAPALINGLEDNNLALGSNGTVEITDAESDPQTVTLTYDDAIAVLHLDPVAGVTIDGNDTDQLTLSGALADINTALPLVSINPQPNVNGGITALTISSNDGFFVGEGFPYPLFQAVNDPPTLTVSIDPLEILEDDTQNLHEAVLTGVTVGDPEPTGQDLSFDANNDNNALFMTQPDLFKSGSNGNVFLRLNPDANGSAMVDFTAMDNGGTANGGDDSTDGQFEIVVLPVNDAPVFNLPGNLKVDEDQGFQGLQTWVNGMDDGDPEVMQALSFETENDNMALFSSQPAIVNNMGTLEYTPAPNAHGSALVTVTLSDDGGTKNGGVDSSSQDFTITINPVNDPPSFVIGLNVEATDVDGAVSIPNWATAISPGPNESGQTVSFQVAGNTAPELFSAGPAVSPTGTLTFTPEPGMSGTAMVDFVLTDDGPNDGANDNTSEPQSATFTIDLALLADIAVTKSNGTAFLKPPGPVIWVITVENLGPEDVEGAEVSDLLPMALSNASWTCAPSGGATCTASGNGDIGDTVDLPAGSQAVYTLTADISGGEGDVISNTVEVSPPDSPVDLNPGNNSATDSDPIALYFNGFEPESL